MVCAALLWYLQLVVLVVLPTLVAARSTTRQQQQQPPPDQGQRLLRRAAQQASATWAKADEQLAAFCRGADLNGVHLALEWYVLLRMLWMAAHMAAFLSLRTATAVATV